MMTTLFNDTELFTSGELQIKKFDLPDAELVLYEHLFNREESDQFYKRLLEETPCKQEPITIHGKTMMTPRLTAWYGKRRGDKHILPFTPYLQTIKDRIEATCGIRFGSVLLN